MKRKAQQGFLAISTVLIVSAVALSIGITVSLLAIGEGQSALAVTKGEDTLAFVESCAEDALMNIRASSSYEGNFTITRPEGTCEITVSRAGNVYTVTATTTNTQYKRTIQSVVTRTTTITTTSWKEI